MSTTNNIVLAGGCFWVKKSGRLLQEVASYSDARKNSDNLNSRCKRKEVSIPMYA